VGGSRSPGGWAAGAVVVVLALAGLAGCSLPGNWGRSVASTGANGPGSSSPALSGVAPAGSPVPSSGAPGGVLIRPTGEASSLATTEVTESAATSATAPPTGSSTRAAGTPTQAAAPRSTVTTTVSRTAVVSKTPASLRPGAIAKGIFTAQHNGTVAFFVEVNWSAAASATGYRVSWTNQATGLAVASYTGTVRSTMSGYAFANGIQRPGLAGPFRVTITPYNAAGNGPSYTAVYTG
jgi:hypothetical protein